MQHDEANDARLVGDVEAEAQASAEIVPFAPPDRANDTDGDDLAGVRELILKAYPDAVGELINGDSVGELLASVPAARDAYARIAETIESRRPIPIPTGSGRRPAVNPEALSPEAKIRAGIGKRG